MIYNKIIKLSALFSILFISIINPVYSVQSTGISHDEVFMDYSKFNPITIRNEADLYFYKAQESITASEKDKYYNAAMAKYYLLTKIDNSQIFPLVQLARIYDYKKKDRYAKEYFYKAKNLSDNAPDANYYFGDFYFKRNDFKRALRYYIIAYNNGYNNRYDLNYQLGTIYEKLADLVNAKRFYEISYSMNPNSEELKEKILLINELNYDKSEYYHFIRE